MRRLLSTPIGSIAALILVAAILYIAYVTIPAANCQAQAQGMQTGYYFHPLDGCFLQNSTGDFYRIDAVTINQP